MTDAMTQIKTLVLVLFLFSVPLIGQSQSIKLIVPTAKQLIFDGYRLDINWENTLYGQSAGGSLTAGLHNTMIGNQAGKQISIGSFNSFFGSGAGLNSMGSGNVFVGYQAGMNESGNNKLYIANSKTSQPLIYGDFLNKQLLINGSLTSEGFETGDLTVSASSPTLSFTSGNNLKYSISYSSTEDKLIISENGNSTNIVEIKDGEIYLPTYAGSTEKNLVIDLAGKVTTKEQISQYTFNELQFANTDEASTYVYKSVGVQLPDGITLDGIEAYILDNNTGSSGVGDTVYVGLYRKNKLMNSFPEQIFRIDGYDTPSGTYELESQLTPYTPGAEVVNNDVYIYLLQTWACLDCGMSEVTILTQ